MSEINMACERKKFLASTDMADLGQGFGVDIQNGIKDVTKSSAVLCRSKHLLSRATRTGIAVLGAEVFVSLSLSLPLSLSRCPLKSIAEVVNYIPYQSPISRIQSTHLEEAFHSRVLVTTAPGKGTPSPRFLQNQYYNRRDGCVRTSGPTTTWKHKFTHCILHTA